MTVSAGQSSHRGHLTYWWRRWNRILIRISSAACTCVWSWGTTGPGSFFTPYSVSKMMAQITLQGLKSHVEARGWASICDPCIGGGAMLISAANIAKEKNINYHDHMLFVGQDIDAVVGKMAYIQLSLLGCPGYIVIADSITNPLTGDPLMPDERPNQDFWYTPFYFKDTWAGRRQVRLMDNFLRSITPVQEKKCKTSGYTFYFDFSGGK